MIKGREGKAEHVLSIRRNFSLQMVFWLRPMINIVLTKFINKFSYNRKPSCGVDKWLLLAIQLFQFLNGEISYFPLVGFGASMRRVRLW